MLCLNLSVIQPEAQNLLDVFITDRPLLVESCNTIYGISDHEAILVTSHVLAPLRPPIERSIYLWSRANFDHIRQELLSLCDEFITTYSSSTPVDVLWNNFLVLCNVGLAMVPTKSTSTQPKQPWVTKNVKRLSRKKQRAYNRTRITGPNIMTLKDNAKENVIKRSIITSLP